MTAPGNEWFRILAPLEGRAVSAGDHFSLRMNAYKSDSLLALVHRGVTFASLTLVYTALRVSFPVTFQLDTVAQMLALQRYLVAPTGLTLLQGTRVNASHGLLDLRHNGSYRVEARAARPAALPPGTTLPMRVQLMKHWAAGLFQLEGWSLGHYYNYSQPGRSRYTALGLDDFGAAQVPLYVGRADTTHVVVGHPVVATGVGASELRIYVTRINEQPLPSSWHVSVNNPTETMMTVAVRQNMALPGLALATTTVTLEPGEMRVLL